MAILDHTYQGEGLRLNEAGLPGDYSGELISGAFRVIRRGQNFGAGQAIIGNGENPETWWLVSDLEALVKEK
jgi:hypothetical protein